MYTPGNLQLVTRETVQFYCILHTTYNTSKICTRLNWYQNTHSLDPTRPCEENQPVGTEDEEEEEEEDSHADDADIINFKTTIYTNVSPNYEGFYKYSCKLIDDGKSNVLKNVIASNDVYIYGYNTESQGK